MARRGCRPDESSAPHDYPDRRGPRRHRAPRLPDRPPRLRPGGGRRPPAPGRRRARVASPPRPGRAAAGVAGGRHVRAGPRDPRGRRGQRRRAAGRRRPPSRRARRRGPARRGGHALPARRARARAGDSARRAAHERRAPHRGPRTAARARERSRRRGRGAADRPQHGPQRHLARGDRALPGGALRARRRGCAPRRRLRAGGRVSRPPEVAALRARMAELSDLHSISMLLFWDQQTMMPPAGAAARAERSATIALAIHARESDPALGALLDALEPWAAGEDPDSDDVRLVQWTRRDFEKSVRVPAELAAEMSKAKALGQQVDLRHPYVACFEGPDHPYDALLDDFEPGLTTAELRPLLAELRDALVPLVAAAGDPEQDRNDGAFFGPFTAEAQRVAVLDVLERVGFDPDAWRLDPAVHPFASGLAPDDVRLTTKYDEQDFAVALYSALHEFGHGLYEAAVDRHLFRTTLDDPVSLGVHESQSRMWENVIGRSRPFCAWLLPRLAETLPGALDGLDAGRLYRAVNTVQPSLIRTEADETTYNLHIVLRFELELALTEGTLSIDELPAAWDEGMQRLLGVEVPGPADGVLQDVHWSAGLLGYFPTYTLGNLIAAQLWDKLADDVPDVDDLLERGEFAPIREWLREHVHRHGRKFPQRELLRRVTDQDLRVEPFLRYLREKLADSGVLAQTA